MQNLSILCKLYFLIGRFFPINQLMADFQAFSLSTSKERHGRQAATQTTLNGQRFVSKCRLGSQILFSQVQVWKRCKSPSLPKHSLFSWPSIKRYLQHIPWVNYDRSFGYKLYRTIVIIKFQKLREYVPSDLRIDLIEKSIHFPSQITLEYNKQCLKTHREHEQYIDIYEET